MSQPSEKSYLLALSNPAPGMEEAFNDWYTNVHLKECVQLDGTLNAQRFKITKAQMHENQPYEYLAMYEVAYGKEAEAIENLKAALPTMNMKPVIDLERSLMMVVRSISDLVTK
jgi:hypothetical protein